MRKGSAVMRSFATGCCLLVLALLMPACEKAARPAKDMVYIDGGAFIMGGVPDPRHHHPERKVKVKSFYIDLHEATNARYGRCVNDGGCPERSKPLPVPFAEPNQPVVMVTYDQAWALCRFEGKYLPSESQWEYAARGKTGRGFPSGDCIDAAEGNTLASEMIKGYRFTFPVGSIPEDKSAFGVYDMTGNVSEIVADPYAAAPQKMNADKENAVSTDEWSRQRVAKGGSFLLPKDRAAAFERRALPDRKFAALWLGFRCAKNK